MGFCQAVVELIVEGRGLEPVLREMERSPAIRVIGSHISSRDPRAEGMRVTVRVAVATAAEARELLGSYLPADGNYTVRPSLG